MSLVIAYVQVWTCDYCGCVLRKPFRELPEKAILPRGWEAGNAETQEGKHFCCVSCTTNDVLEER